MKKILVLLLALVAAPAAAQDAGAYLGLHIGQSTFRGTCDEFNVPGISCDDKDSAFKLLAGYQFNRHLAAEVAYGKLGEVIARGPAGTATAEVSVFELVAVGSLPLTDKFSLYAKAGLYRGDTEARLDTLTIVDSASETNTDLTFGVGARFDITKNIGVRAEWQRYPNVGGPDTGEDDIDVMSVGLIVRF